MDGRRMNIGGVQFTFGTAESGLWWDSDQNHDWTTDPKDEHGGKRGFGLVVKFWCGHVVRPILHPRWWLSRAKPNVWFDTSPDVRWFVIRFRSPVPILPFVSFAAGRFGFYFGFKDFGVWHEEYEAWLPATEVSPSSRAVTPSASIRSTRIK